MQTPNSADVRIYNVADSTAERIKNEFTQVVIQAGYQANFGLVFRGTIKQIRKGREDAKDTYVDITAADGDAAYNFSPNRALLGRRHNTAGTTPQDDVQHTCHQTGHSAQYCASGYIGFPLRPRFSSNLGRRPFPGNQCVQTRRLRRNASSRRRVRCTQCLSKALLSRQAPVTRCDELTGCNNVRDATVGSRQASKQSRFGAASVVRFGRMSIG
jgi:hypothetical protein